jgi:hypothetical protein
VISKQHSSGSSRLTLRVPEPTDITRRSYLVEYSCSHSYLGVLHNGNRQIGAIPVETAGQAPLTNDVAGSL